MARVLFKPAAQKDVAHLVHFLFSQSPETASQFHAAVEDTCERLAESPELGELVASDVRALAEVRVWSVSGFSNHLIFYRPRHDGVEVIRILHAARDWLAIIKLSNDS